MVNSKHVTGIYCVYQCLDVLVPQPITITLSSPAGQTEWRIDYHRQHRTILSFFADEGHGTSCSTHTASSTLSGGMADVGLIDPWVGVEVDVRELRRNAVDQLASGYNSSRSAALPV